MKDNLSSPAAVEATTPDAYKQASLWFDEWELILPADARESFKNDLLRSLAALASAPAGAEGALQARIQELLENIAGLNVLVKSWREKAIAHGYTDEYVERDRAALAGEPAVAADEGRDAARYRWLRDGNDAKDSSAMHIAKNCYGFEWDAAIDAAMAASQDEQQEKQQ